MPEDFDPIEVWPECWPAWQLFCEVSGQWRMTPAGTVMALDYGPLFERMKQLDLSRDHWEELFDNVRVIESAAIQTINAR